MPGIKLGRNKTNSVIYQAFADDISLLIVQVDPAKTDLGKTA